MDVGVELESSGKGEAKLRFRRGLLICALNRLDYVRHSDGGMLSVVW